MGDELISLTGNHKTITEVNRALVIRYIRECGPISAPELAELVNMSLSTTSAYIRHAVRDGLIQEAGFGESRGGRRPILYKFNPGVCLTVCLEIETTHVSAAIVDFNGNILDDANEEIINSSPESVIQASLNLIEFLSREIPENKPILGIGVSCPGTVDAKTGTVKTATNLGWRKPVALAKRLREALNLPVYVYNDADAAVLGEKYFGAAQGVRNVAYIMLETGIGAGLIINDSLCLGNTREAGNIGHTIVVKDGLACACGDYGCLEAYCSAPAILSRVVSALIASDVGHQRSSPPQISTLEQVIEQANNGDTMCIDALSEASRYLSIAMLNLTQLLAPDLIVIGELISRSPDLMEPAIESIKRRFAGQIRIEVSTLGKKAKILGVSTGIIERALGPSIVKAIG